MKHSHNASKIKTPDTHRKRVTNLHSLQVDVLQVTVVEVEVTAVSLLIGELHQVWRDAKMSQLLKTTINTGGGGEPSSAFGLTLSLLAGVVSGLHQLLKLSRHGDGYLQRKQQVTTPVASRPPSPTLRGDLPHAGASCGTP